MRYAAQNILLVEDDPVDAALFSDMLLENPKSQEKYHITHFDTAEKALREDIEHEYDIVFLDMNLPGVSGFDAVEKIQSRSMNTPIVILTGNNDEESAESAIKNGCQDYLIKGENSASAIKKSIRYAIDRKEFENRLLKLARYDSLTEIMKREVFYEQVDKAVSLSKRNDIKIAVLFIDLDNFKHINDHYGHMAGDRVLSEVSRRLKRCIRSHDTVARFGGDEFVILLEGMKSEVSDCHTIARRITKSISEPVKFGNDLINTSCSIGIATFPECGDDTDSLVNNADIALQLAKESGKNKYRFYSKALNKKISKKIDIEIGLREAIANEEIDIYYQPIVNISENRLEGAEALARWNSKEFGRISPTEFIPIAEKTGMISDLGNLILKNACKDYLVLKNIVKQPFNLSLNVSAIQFEEKDFVSEFLKKLEETNISPKHISVEVTEGVFLRDSEETQSSLSKFKEAGVKIYLDDFGTGYSSLGYLSKLPFDTLKIDKSFTYDIASNNNSQVISRAIMGIAHSLNLKVISEGVENKKQLNYLQDIGCDKIQGFYFAKPMPVDKFCSWIVNNY